MEKRVFFRSSWLPWALIAPQVAVIALFFFWPAAQALLQSVQQSDAFGTSVEWVGLDNFRNLWNDDTYLASFYTTAIFSSLVALAGLSVSLLLAVFADRIVRGALAFKTLLIWPYAVAPAVAGVLWLFMFAPSVGVVSYWLRALGVDWNQHFGVQAWLKDLTGAEFHDFAGSVVVHAVGGWIALPAVILLGARANRYRKDGGMSAHPPSSIPFLALGAWILTVGWFGFNVMSAQTLDKISGLVAVNSLMAMVGGTLAALVLGKNDPGFVHNGPLAGLVAVCAGSDVMHPLGALMVGVVAGALFVTMFTLTQNKWKIDDVLGVWPLHGLCGTWGGIAAGIFGSKALGGLGGVSLGAQALGTALGVAWAVAGGLLVYGTIKATLGLRLSQEEEFDGADISIHRISATPEREANW